MAGITLEQAQAQLDAALAGRAAMSGAVQETQNSGTTGGRKTVFRSLEEADRSIEYWNTQVKRLSAERSGRSRVSYGVACG